MIVWDAPEPVDPLRLHLAERTVQKVYCLWKNTSLLAIYAEETRAVRELQELLKMSPARDVTKVDRHWWADSRGNEYRIETRDVHP